MGPRVTREWPLAWAATVADYSTALSGAGKSDLTIRNYLHYLHKVAAVYPEPWDVDEDDLEELLGLQVSADARKSLRTAVRSFYRWGRRKRYIDVDPAYDLEPVRVFAGRRRDPAPELVVSQLVDDVRVPERLVFMGELAAFCGLRAAEISRVNRDDLDEVARRLRVHGKGGKVRWVPVEDDVLLGRLCELEEGAWAFPSSQGGHIGAGWVTELMSRALPGTWTAHTFRHRFATVSNEEDPNLVALAEVLGHASVATTQLYTKTSDRQLRAVVAAGGRRRTA